MLLLVALGMVGCASAPQPEVASKIEVSMMEPVIEPEVSTTPDVNEILTVYTKSGVAFLTAWGQQPERHRLLRLRP